MRSVPGPALITSLVLASLAVAPQASGHQHSTEGEAVQVDRIVDGDTIDVVGGTGSFRVRFLNVNTPEVGSCLADEATSATASMLPLGATATLRYDVDRTDPYDRVLAWVERDGTAVPAELARQGLAVPLLVEPNDRFYAVVVRASRQARKDGVGLFDPSIGCTPEAQMQRAEAAIAGVVAAKVTSRSRLNRQLSVLGKAAAVKRVLTPRRFGLTGAYFRQYLRERRVTLGRAVTSTRKAKKSQFQRHLQGGGKRPTPVRPPAPIQTPAPVPTPVPVPTPTSVPPPVTPVTNWPAGVPSGYTGPRCYAPGGGSWRPC